MTTPRILLVDAYDSFSNNIVQLIRDSIPNARVEIIKINDGRFVLNDDAFVGFLHHFHAVVAGPGPGHPANLNDVGLIARLWTLSDEHLLPVLGICLGFQSLALAFGGRVERLREPRHGLVTRVTHHGDSIFKGTGEVMATQYHSLHVRLPDTDVPPIGHQDLWSSTTDLQDLAWDLEDERNGPILMAVQHRSKPFYGVQYHPESVCTNDEGRKFITEWWRDVCMWNRKYRKPIDVSSNGLHSHIDATGVGQPGNESTVQWTSLKLEDQHLDPVQIVKSLRESGQECLLLESGTRYGKALQPQTGRFTILGLHSPSSLQVRYFTNSQMLEISSRGTIERRQSDISGVFSYLRSFLKQNEFFNGRENLPFWGGFVGFISYEAGLEIIGVATSVQVSEPRPDVWFVFVERSITFDHVDLVAYVQTIRTDDSKWMSQMSRTMTGVIPQKTTSAVSQPRSPGKCKLCTPAHVDEFGHDGIARYRGDQDPKQSSSMLGPQQTEYCDIVRECQSHVRAGSSYELCLTDQTLVSVPEGRGDPWELYKRLRALNPSPFGSYLDLEPYGSMTGPGVSILSSSPERFLSWSRSGSCQYRPIKGTVKKGPGTGMTRMKAKKLLSSVKEQAENLMIVDLIRHDLHGVEGVQDVRVKQLMCVEEYETVFQLVSVIEGQLRGGNISGVDVLAASLPPGSMTGAPKKRSCELLQGLESGRPRGIYSGVLGYMDVGGGGDFSVVIRTAFKWDDEDAWRLGAGGAVTALSDPDAEWEEMVTKRESVLRAFV